MANEEQLKILEQGIETWNKWRVTHPKINIDLSEVDLFRSYRLSGANFGNADLRDAKFMDSIINGADFSEANLRGSYFRDADLNGTNFSQANLSDTDFQNANLYQSNLSNAYLNGANFSYAKLAEANLSLSELVATNFSNAKIGHTVFLSTDLSEARGLGEVKHSSPSFIDTATIHLSKGKIPEAFLRGCGFNDLDIEYSKLYKPDISNEEINSIISKIFDLRAHQSIQISPLFISYSHADTRFVEKLEPHLTRLGIRFWRDVHNATAGRLEKQIDLAMRQNPTVLLILSENSINSDWVEHEARLARNLEKEIGRDVLCPIALDASWKSAKWPARLIEQIKEYNILDYSKWDDDKVFEQVFNKMISGLDMFYKR